MFSSKELKSDCIVSSEGGMQVAELNKVKISANMTRINTKWQGRPVTVAHFANTKSNWTNTAASLVAGQPIRGNAVIIGATTAEIIAEQQRPRSWASLASKLPVTLELDDRGRERLLQEQRERNAAWREYHQRKVSRRRGVNLDHATVDLATGELVGEMTDVERAASEEADAAFAEWDVDEAALADL